MPKVNEFGQQEGIADRLIYWSETFRKDSRYPWVGLGFIADLECAARLLGGNVPNPVEIAEYDL